MALFNISYLSFLGLKLANTSNPKYPKRENVLIPQICILLTSNNKKNVTDLTARKWFFQVLLKT